MKKSSLYCLFYLVNSGITNVEDVHANHPAHLRPSALKPADVKHQFRTAH